MKHSYIFLIKQFLISFFSMFIILSFIYSIFTIFTMNDVFQIRLRAYFKTKKKKKEIKIEKKRKVKNNIFHYTKFVLQYNIRRGEIIFIKNNMHA